MSIKRIPNRSLRQYEARIILEAGGGEMHIPGEVLYVKKREVREWTD